MTDLREAIINRLGGNLHTGMCRCPMHEDDTASLHVSSGEGGKVLLKCHAGCSQDAVVGWCKQAGLWEKKADRSWRPANPRRRPVRQPDNQPGDADRSERFHRAVSILRAAAKYAKENPDAARRLMPYLNGRGIDRLPLGAMYLPPTEELTMLGNYRDYPALTMLGNYRHYPAMVKSICDNESHLRGALVTFLNRDGTQNLRGDKGKSVRRMFGPIKGGFVQLTAWPQADQPLIVAEGVEDAMSLAQLHGHAAIAALSANNMKALKAPPCSELLVFADNDDTGQEAAPHLAARHHNAGGTVCLLSPPADFKDWNEALQAASERDLENYRRQLAEARPFEGAYQVTALTMREVLELEVPDLEYLVEPWLTKASLAMVHAQRGEGKTRFVMAVTHAVATGQDFAAWQVPAAARVLYVDGELPTALLQKRLKELGEASENFCVVSRDILLREGVVLPDLATDEGRAFLDAIIERHHSEVIVLDSLSTLIRSGIENEAESWAPIQYWMLGHRSRGRTVILIHHQGKSGTPRGTSKKEDTLDTVIALEEVKDDDEASDTGSTFKLKFGKKREFYGKDAAPLLLHLSTVSGTAEWSHELARDKQRDTAEALRQQGMTQGQIATELGVTQQRVSKLLKKHVRSTGTERPSTKPATTARITPRNRCSGSRQNRPQPTREAPVCECSVMPLHSTANRYPVAVKDKRLRSRVTNGRSHFVETDRRTAWARRWSDIHDQIVADLGGADLLSEGQRQLIRRAATIALTCERMEGKAAAGADINLADYGMLTDRLGRTFHRLG
jgi:putative DNA primase/helicase